MRAVGVVLVLIGGFGVVVTVLSGLLAWAAVAFWEAVDGSPAGWLGALALAGAWLYTTALMAGLARRQAR